MQINLPTNRLLHVFLFQFVCIKVLFDKNLG